MAPKMAFMIAMIVMSVSSLANAETAVEQALEAWKIRIHETPTKNKLPDFVARHLGEKIAGPNCYFAAIKANHFYSPPAITLSERLAAILFLNRAACQPTSSPSAGDIGLVPLERDTYIGHVFTYVTPNLRFEKLGADDKTPYELNTEPLPSSLKASFVDCRKLSRWMTTIKENFSPKIEKIDQKLSRLERNVDRYNRDPIQPTDEDLKWIVDTRENLFNQLQGILYKRGVRDIPTPYPSKMTYYSFAKIHSELLEDKSIFTELWLIDRLNTLIEIQL